MEIFTIFPSWLLTTTASLFFTFCIFLYTLNSNRSPITTPKLPPGPPKLPIIGHLHKLLGKPRHQALWQLSKQYGPIMLLHIGSKPFLIISSPAMAKQVLKTHDHIFCSRPSSSKAVKRLTYDYLDIAFSPQTDRRKEKRKILVSEFLGPKRARSSFNHVLVTETETMVRALELHASNVSVANLDRLFLSMVKGVVCKVAFGDKYRQQPIKGPSWEVMVVEALEMLGGSVGDSFDPWVGRIIDQVSGWNRKLETCFSNLDAYIESIINDHKNQIAEDEKDFVHTLLDLSSADDTSSYRLTKEDIKSLIMDILTGGVDTTVVTLSWAMSEIARSVRVMRKLQNEIRNHAGRKQKVDVLELDLTKMTYLKMTVKETLRLHPPAPLLIPHECTSHCEVGGYDIFPGTSALINAWGIGRDPSIWGENAGEFYPERFEKFEVDFEMVPFGGGRRSCPAMNTAPATVEFVIANLLYWFDWEVPDGVKNEDLNMQEESNSLVLRKKLPLCLVPTKYNWED